MNERGADGACSINIDNMYPPHNTRVPQPHTDSTDVTAAMSALRSRHPNAQAFRLVYSPSCKNRLCHGDALAIELRAFLSASES